MLAYMPIQEEKKDSKRRFYYKRYEDNLFCPMDGKTFCAYDNGSGAETKPTVIIKDGKKIITPAKMASIASSSAMTFNLLGNGSVTISSGDVLPRGTYEVEYEKQMCTVSKGSKPANLDAFLSNEDKKIAIFCEMKMLEWLGTPSCLKKAYRSKDHYFETNYLNIGSPVDAYEVFNEIIEQMKRPNSEKSGDPSVFRQYDAWQMLKHLLAIYNYTSFATKNAVNSFSDIPSMAGKYEKIILANVVNEFPLERIRDLNTREEYANALRHEREEAEQFIDIIQRSGIPRLFDNNCDAGIEVKYISAKDFAGSLNMSREKSVYLRRYF